jgi:hypothetical protein
MDSKAKTAVFLNMRVVSSGKHVPYPTRNNPNTKRVTGYRASWYSRRGTEFYKGSRQDTEEEAARLAYAWLDRQDNLVDTTVNMSAWNRNRNLQSASEEARAERQAEGGPLHEGEK